MNNAHGGKGSTSARRADTSVLRLTLHRPVASTPRRSLRKRTRDLMKPCAAPRLWDAWPEAAEPTAGRAQSNRVVAVDAFGAPTKTETTSSTRGDLIRGVDLDTMNRSPDDTLFALLTADTATDAESCSAGAFSRARTLDGASDTSLTGGMRILHSDQEAELREELIARGYGDYSGQNRSKRCESSSQLVNVIFDNGLEDAVPPNIEGNAMKLRELPNPP